MVYPLIPIIRKPFCNSICKVYCNPGSRSQAEGPLPLPQLYFYITQNTCENQLVSTSCPAAVKWPWHRDRLILWQLVWSALEAAVSLLQPYATWVQSGHWLLALYCALVNFFDERPNSLSFKNVVFGLIHIWARRLSQTWSSSLHQKYREGIVSSLWMKDLWVRVCWLRWQGKHQSLVLRLVTCVTSLFM